MAHSCIIKDASTTHQKAVAALRGGAAHRMTALRASADSIREYVSRYVASGKGLSANPWTDDLLAATRETNRILAKVKR